MFSIAKLLPRDKVFFKLLTQLAAEAVTTAKHLQVMIDSKNPADRTAAAKAISATKEDAKRISSTTTKELCQTFITPFDREDIQDLAALLYKIPKTVEKVSEYVELYEVAYIEDLRPQTEVIVREAAAMESMIQALVQGGRKDHILKQAAVLDQLETEGDEILRRLLATLLKNTTDARELIIHKDLYDLLERVIDRYRDVASIGLQISLKNG